MSGLIVNLMLHFFGHTELSFAALGPARVREELRACGYGGEGLFWRGGE
eukprot:SAG25_NODE_186_length_12406_cov_7.083530_14_plen_49_part_00